MTYTPYHNKGMKDGVVVVEIFHRIQNCANRIKYATRK